MEKQFTHVKLKKRVLSQYGKEAGWTIIGVNNDRERDVLAVLSSEVGLDLARLFSELVAQKLGVDDIQEDFDQRSLERGQSADYQIN